MGNENVVSVSEDGVVNIDQIDGSESIEDLKKKFVEYWKSTEEKIKNHETQASELRRLNSSSQRRTANLEERVEALVAELRKQKVMKEKMMNHLMKLKRSDRMKLTRIKELEKDVSGWRRIEVLERKIQELERLEREERGGEEANEEDIDVRINEILDDGLYNDD